MRKRLALWLRLLAAWLDPQGDKELVPRMLLTAAGEVVRRFGDIAHTGAFKKALAMKAMITNFPRTSQAQLSLAIELALKQLKDEQK
jgi:hypothetical protein